MNTFFNKKINKVCLLCFLFLFVMGITSCRQGNWAETTYTTWAAEFTGFSNFWTAMWGWPIAILSYPIAWLCSNIGHALGNSFAWGIFFTTLIVRTLAWPIYSKQSSMNLKMQVMQPELNKIQRKYANRTDPESKQRMNMETMALYKKNHFSPVGCMVMTFLQFPIFMSMYEVVRRINLTTSTVLENGVATVIQSGKFALADTRLFGLFELNTSFTSATEIKDKIFVVVLALVYGAVTFISQKLASKKPSYQKNLPNVSGANGANNQAQQMQTMNKVMTVMFVLFALTSASLAFYWLIGGLYQMLQTYIGRKANEKQYYKMKNKI